MRENGFSVNVSQAHETSAGGLYTGAHDGRRLWRVAGRATHDAAMGERIGKTMLCDSANATALAIYGHAFDCYGQAIANGQARAWKFPKSIPKNGFSKPILTRKISDLDFRFLDFRKISGSEFPGNFGETYATE